MEQTQQTEEIQRTERPQEMERPQRTTRHKQGPTRLREVVAPVLLAMALGFGVTAASAQELPVTEVSGQARADTSEAAPATTTRINLNTATAAELETLPGIGPSKAAAIIAYRERRPFQRVRDVMRVRGIGRATYRNLRELVAVE